VGDVSAIEPEWQDDAEVRSLYVNNTAIALSQWDVTVDFQLAAPPPRLTQGENLTESRQVARIVMSPTHAKVLAESISKAVGDWEERFGALPSVDELLQRGQDQPDPPDSADAAEGQTGA
jgi:hypothetical protein